MADLHDIDLVVALADDEEGARFALARPVARWTVDGVLDVALLWGSRVAYQIWAKEQGAVLPTLIFQRLVGRVSV